MVDAAGVLTSARWCWLTVLLILVRQETRNQGMAVIVLNQPALRLTSNLTINMVHFTVTKLIVHCF
ncbi:MAG: hypothetical protein ACLS3V_02700 [Streptococcus sp.]